MEGAAFADVRLDADAPTHEVDEFAADRQAEAAASIAPGNAAVGLREAHEKRR